ncbi:MAG: F0F1 ATP synthase subunit delta [Actinomycetes bacterium]
MMNSSLQGYAAAIIAELDASNLATVTAELAQLDATMAANRDLRAAMTDTSVTGVARRAVLTQVLSGKVSAPTVRLAGNAALVSNAQDVPAAISFLAQRAREADRDGGYDEPTLSVTGARQRVGGFASATFEDLDNSDLEGIEEELFRFARTVEATPELRRAMIDRDLPVNRRQGIIEALVGSKASPSTTKLLKYVVAGGRARDVVGTVDWLVDQAAKARGWRVAKVRTGKPLAEAQADRLRTSLSRVSGHPVELQVTDDVTLLGGVRIEVGDLLVDATARGRLEQLREHLEADHRTFQKND